MADQLEDVRKSLQEALLSNTNEDAVDDFDPFSGVVEINEYVDVDLNAPPESEYVKMFHTGFSNLLSH